MKRQSKPEKIKKEKSTAPGEWLYFAPANVTVRSIYEVLTDDYEVEIWEDAGVLEIGLNDGATLDIEWTKIPAKDDITAGIAKHHGCVIVFIVTLISEVFETEKKSMSKIAASLGGLFCGDTEDFTPVLQ